MWQEQTDWLAEMFNLAKEKAQAAGITFVSHNNYQVLTPDMSKLILEAKKAGAEVVFSGPVLPIALRCLSNEGADIIRKPSL